MPTPTYLRVVVTARCSLACAYCHAEGDPATDAIDGLPTSTLLALLHAGLDNGVRKLKFLGGEPLLRRDLPAVIASLRARDRDLDVSLITGGAVGTDRLDACFAAGLSRANLSIHGFGLDAFRERTQRGAPAFALRNATLRRLLDHGRFLKLNFVWRGPSDDADLALLLDAARAWPVVVAVLDDLSQPQLGPHGVRAAVERLRGPPDHAAREDDPHSLPTLQLGWADGLRVEVKDAHLGQQLAWSTCLSCPLRTRCREGILALRLTHDGRLRPCMDRPDLGLDLAAVLDRDGPTAAATAWRRYATLAFLGRPGLEAA